jgi:hypothetical protein
MVLLLLRQAPMQPKTAEVIEKAAATSNAAYRYIVLDAGIATSSITWAAVGPLRPSGSIPPKLY